jgi:hypothetical protein
MKQQRVAKPKSVTLSPALRAADASANYWMRQATLRLRREVAWCWRERTGQTGADAAALPPFTDKAAAALVLSRFWEEKQRFFLTDPTARYLSEQLGAARPRKLKRPPRGSFSWLAATLALDDAASFVLALALTTAFDASMGSVIATCLNDQTRTQPNLALAQRLWDEPEQILRLADARHPLFRYGLITRGQAGAHAAETDWYAPLTTPALVAQQIIFPAAPFPHGLKPLADERSTGRELTEAARLVALRLAAADSDALRVVPLLGPRGSARRDTVRAIARANKKQVVEFADVSALADNNQYLDAVATLCWLKDAYLFFSQEPQPAPAGDKTHHAGSFALPSASIPAALFVAVSERSQFAHVPANLLLPIVNVPALTYAERVAYWQQALGAKAKHLTAAIEEAARRFRYEPETLAAICAALNQLPGKLSDEDLFAACRAELDLDIGELASRVEPRFDQEELILPHKQNLQFAEHLRAMRALTEVHYVWGTAKAWNESGISVLFAGPPGTGKTMAAEILASKLQLPMYRIDLSQVVNKYIGETEKNLKRLFDAADISDMILFFDEADALFGKRSEVKDAHDRYANLEISYLLERVERFKGLAILATNRQKDLDEAFLRRLRYTIEFPLPDEAERRRIWQQVIPAGADSSALDLNFLARQFQLAGGHIRSIVFNACLQAAGTRGADDEGPARRLTMTDVLVAVKREYEKMNRTLSLEQFGRYAPVIQELEH